MTLPSNKKTLILLVILFLQLGTFAQGDPNPTVEMADGLYQSGKIYVVIIALILIFVGIITYLILLDRKISRLEKELKKN